MEVNAFDKGNKWATGILLRKKVNNFPEGVWFTINEAAVMPLPLKRNDPERTNKPDVAWKPNRMNAKSVEAHIEYWIQTGELVEKEVKDGVKRYKRTGTISINELLDEIGLEELLDLEMKSKLDLPYGGSFTVFCADNDRERCDASVEVVK